MPKKLIKHYYNQCIGCGACFSLAPNLFQANPNTFKAELINGTLDSSQSSDNPEAFTYTEANESELDDATATLVAASCPVQIIKVETSKEN